MSQTIAPVRVSIALEITLLLLVSIALTGCQVSAEGAPDGIRVSSSSKLFQTAARDLAGSCNQPAEFGRCGCYLDGIETSCDLVARCLENGFCKVQESEPEGGTRVQSESKAFSAAARALMEPCNNPAEFGRCGCHLDGFLTSCAVVQRCLDAGFCKVVRE